MGEKPNKAASWIVKELKLWGCFVAAVVGGAMIALGTARMPRVGIPLVIAYEAFILYNGYRVSRRYREAVGERAERPKRPERARS